MGNGTALAYGAGVATPLIYANAPAIGAGLAAGYGATAGAISGGLTTAGTAMTTGLAAAGSGTMAAGTAVGGALGLSGGVAAATGIGLIGVGAYGAYRFFKRDKENGFAKRVVNGEGGHAAMRAFVYEKYGPQAIKLCEDYASGKLKGAERKEARKILKAIRADWKANDTQFKAEYKQGMHRSEQQQQGQPFAQNGYNGQPNLGYA